MKKRLARGDKGINPLDSACKEHDIAYDHSKSIADRNKADYILEQRAWDRFKAKDSSLKEKAVAWGVTTAMKAKRKVGGGCGFKAMVKASKNVIKKNIGEKNLTKLTKKCVAVARKSFKTKKTKVPRTITIIFYTNPKLEIINCNRIYKIIESVFKFIKKTPLLIISLFLKIQKKCVKK